MELFGHIIFLRRPTPPHSQALPPHFQDEMAANEDTKTIIPAASVAMSELMMDREQSEAELFALVKKAFETFVHLRVRGTSP